MDLRIRGKTALVFGAAGGLGGAIAHALAAEGAQLALADVDEKALNATATALERTGAAVMPLLWDLADLAIVGPQIAAIEQRFGVVDILVNNTGGPPPAPVAGQDPALWTQSFQSMRPGGRIFGAGDTGG
jgi:3-oxoacyl-[acyl-carrier protein] reductase